MELVRLLSVNSLWVSRLKGIGRINRRLCIYSGFSGIVCRASGIALDGRNNSSEVYDCLTFSSYISFGSDCLDRYYLRINEMAESIRIVTIGCVYGRLSSSIGYGLRYGTDISTNPTTVGIVGGMAGKVQGSNNFMELVIEEFLHFFPFVYSGLVSIRSIVESSKGMYSIFLSNFPV